MLPYRAGRFYKAADVILQSSWVAGKEMLPQIHPAEVSKRAEASWIEAVASGYEDKFVWCPARRERLGDVRERRVRRR
jgi:hypothetical protein